jgi:N-acyl-D-amino-acid deacylase
MSDILIKGGTIVDGTAAPSYKADILIKDGVIVQIAADLTAAGARELDASGAIVAPGFIDSHTHLDAALFWDPAMSPMAQHGVTSVLIGNCALGLAPVRPGDRETVVDLLSYLEDIPTSAIDAAVKWEWQSYADYATALRGRALGLNVVSLVPHSLLRIYVMGDDAWNRAATPEETERMAAELADALKAGAIGLSYSMFDKDRHGRPVPSRLAEDIEIERLFKVLGEHNALFQCICNSQSKMETLERLGGYSSQYGVTVLDNALLHFEDRPEVSASVAALLTRLNAAGGRIFAMMSPRSFDLEVNFFSTLCFVGYPVWNELVQASPAEKRSMLDDPTWRDRAREEFRSTSDVLFPTHKPTKIQITSVAPGIDKAWIGRSLGDLVAERGGDISDVLADWVVENDLECRFVVPLGNTNVEKVGELLRHPNVFVSASDAGAHLQMFCAVGDTTLFLTRYVRDTPLFTIEEGVHELTGKQAELLNLPDRGRIAVGLPADITVFALEDLEWRDQELVHDLPGGAARFTRPGGGFRFTLVNGELAQDNGRETPKLSGTYIEHREMTFA